MPISDDLAALFRSFASDDAAAHADEDAAALQARQRWPLLKAISPTAVAPAAPLTDHEMQAWRRSPVRPAVERARPASADLGTRLAESLERMVGRR